MSTVTYYHWTGHVVPAWSEEYILSETRVLLTRTGDRDSDIHAGTWEFETDPERVALLFAQLKAVDWASIEAIEPDDPIDDSGMVTSYTITCSRNDGPSLVYAEGRTYRGGEAVTKPIEDFISGLTLPPDAHRYVSPGPSN